MTNRQASFLPAEPEPFSGATISDDGRYRFALWRSWGEPGFPKRYVNFVMLNPSKADATDDDPTIRRCLAFAKSWGHTALVVTNLYAFRATYPVDLWKADDPVGPGNDELLCGVALAADRTLVAWGNHGVRNNRARLVAAMLRGAGVTLHALRLTGQKQPQHPLFLPANLSPFVWEGPR